MKINTYIKEISNDFVKLLFPSVCISCQTSLVKQENYLCLKCRLSLPKTNYHLKPDNLLDKKFVYEPKVQKASAFLYFNKGGIAQKIIHEIKYNNQPELGELTGEWYGHDLLDANWPIDLIIPVPLHRTKLARRGFNQSDAIAQGISIATGWPVRTDLVIRRRKTNSQTKKSKVERWKNMQSVYRLTKTGSITDKTILVVDDVLTTGATIGELVTALSQSGAKAIYIVTLAAGT